MSQESGTLDLSTGEQFQYKQGKKKWPWIVGGIAIVVIIVLVVTLSVTLTRNNDPEEEEQTTTTEPTTVDPPQPPPVTDPPVTDPPITDPPITDPPVTDPPITDPPVTDPPITDPPVTDPPVTDPPVTDPPVTDPPGPEIELEDIINGVFTAPSFNGTWTLGNEVLYRNTEGDLVLFDVDEGTYEVLIPYSNQLLQQSERLTELSPDRSNVVLAYEVQQVYRHSFLAQYACLDVSTSTVVNILPPGVTTQALLQNFVWGPTGTSLAFVYMNNIFYQESLTSPPQQLTANGVVNVIYNGIPDWVYEEEIFSSHNALWFAPDGSRIAYASFDDTNVRIMHVPHFGTPGSVDYQYTQHHEIRYPKVGTTNPMVSVTLHNLAAGSATIYHHPLEFDDPVLKRVTFVTNDVIALLWTNRVQNSLIVELCTQGSPTCTTIYQYNEPNGWIDNIPIVFNEAGNAFITILPSLAQNGELYKQVVQVSDTNVPDAMWTISARTTHIYTVRNILHWTPDDVIWFQATSITDSAQLHIFTTNAAGGVFCFTCNIERDDGGECLYNDGFVSTEATRVVINCLGPGIPQIFIFDSARELIGMWDENSLMTELVAELTLPQTIRLSVPVADGLPNADVLIQVPDDYEERNNVPLLVNVYGGPDTAQVTLRWSIDWGTSLVDRWGIAVAHIDGRGSGLRGVDNLFALNRRLGTVEVEDQITATRYIHENLPWVDSNRTCIWGWSYGGYAASLALARGEDVFRCAMAVAPVTDWRYYDTLYTERYMGLPEENAQGYADSTLIAEEVAEAYRDKRYFLIHGTEDDNVHYQHAMVFSRLLQRANVYFKQMSYTDQNHALSDVLPHLYEALEHFLQENMF